MLPIASGDREGNQQGKEPSQKQTAPAEVPEQALQSGVKCAHPKLHKGVPRRRRTTQEVVQYRLEWRGPRLGCAQRIPSESAQEPE
ncbi:hypothetical protein NDU88_009973 [Pleurodeles waltl]|uniref:Uncharacterized protein n=1 Tax=Pleurodeles waltl TaxID=8319 RepID=A0AAV7QZ01_PLEWA|nr:hypothetical protein NDU88_009973 [Pleurodeles waltl]